MNKDLSSYQRIFHTRLENRETSALVSLLEPYFRESLCIVLNIGAYYETIEEFANKLRGFNERLSKNKVTIVAVRGSDDNPELFKDENWDALSNIKLAEDYTLLQICGGKNMLLIGGDVSLDKEWKVEHGRYWPGEEPIFDVSKITSPLETLVNYDFLVLGLNTPSICRIIKNDWVEPDSCEAAIKSLEYKHKLSEFMFYMYMAGHRPTILSQSNTGVGIGIDTYVPNYRILGLDSKSTIYDGDFQITQDFAVDEFRY